MLPKVLELQQLVDDLGATLAGQEALIRNIEGKQADEVHTAFGGLTPGGSERGRTANWEKFRGMSKKGVHSGSLETMESRRI